MKKVSGLKYFLGLFVIAGCSDLTLCSCDQEDVDRYSTLRRIANLKADYISPATGIAEDFREEYQKEIRKFGIWISDEAFIDKNICRFADTDANRFERLKRSIYSDSDIVWTTRGGFGSYKLIDRLAALQKPKKRKVFIGFSDITALNLYISQNWQNWTVIHAPMIVYTGKKRYHHNNWLLLMDILERKINKYEIKGLTPLNDFGKKKLTITGKLMGGNLTLLESSIKTNREVDTDNKILFV